jgi:hypothetical protein
MESLVVRPARPDDAPDLARNWIDGARHYAALDADAFQVHPAEGLVAWFEGLLRRPQPDDAPRQSAVGPVLRAGLGYARRSIVFEKRLA